MCNDVNSPRERSGFTLIEMIVVIAIVGFLIALTMALSPNLTSSSRITSGTSTVQSTLFTAKSMALRDQFPRGVRLVPDSDGFVRTLQYLEQPTPYVNGVVVSIDPTALIATFNGADFSTGAVLPGDYLDVFDPNAKSLSLITGIVSVNNPPQLQLASSPSANLSYPRTYRIIRGPRPMIGEKQVDLPKDIVIDLTATAQGGLTIIQPDQPTPTQTNYDILFSPTGQVTRANVTLGKVILWIHDFYVTKNQGEQYFIVVNTHTGLVGTYPVDITVGGDPYSFTKSGRGSGM